MSLLQSLHNMLPVSMTSLVFVYVYLPVSLLAYHLAPEKLKAPVLLAASLGFCAVTQPDRFWLAIAAVFFDYAVIWGIITSKKSFWRKVFLWACIVKGVALIACFEVTTRASAPPLALTVMSVSGISCALESYAEEEPSPHGFIRVALYILFFPRLYAGPMIQYGEFCGQLDKPSFDGQSIAVGFGRFATGALKYAGFGRALFWLYESVRLIPAADESVLSAWVLILSFMLSLYFTLSGLSDMARGVAGMFGIGLPLNFYYPYQSRSASDFFERFNMTVGRFLSRVALGPPQPEGNSRVAGVLNLLLMGMLWGMWFGIKANYMAWGAFIAIFMIMEKYLYPAALEAMPTLFSRGYAFCVAVVGFVIFSGGTLPQSLGSMNAMLGQGGIPLLNDRIRYLLSSNWALLALSLFFATNIMSLITGFIRKSLPRASWIMFGVTDVGILILFTAVTLGGGYV